MDKHKIGLFGFGCVGQGFYDTLKYNDHLQAKVAKICVKSAGKKRSVKAGLLTYNPDDILEDGDIDIIVEVIDDAQVAFEIVSTALKKGKKVISANKKMIAGRLPELIELEANSSGKFLFEGAVAGSIPILQNISNFYSLEKVSAIRGILNGSTNYILTKIENDNVTYGQALAEAQKKGFAETDPALDVGAFDPAFKLSILLWRQYGLLVNPKDIFTIGIDRLQPYDFEFAKAHNLKIKLVGEARRMGNKIVAWVAPQFVSIKDPLHNISYEQNAILIEGEFAGNQLLVGNGAGKLPTGIAVLSDLKNLLSNSDHVPVEADNDLQLADPLVSVYCSHANHSLIDWQVFEAIEEKYASYHSGHLLGTVRLSRLQTLYDQNPKARVLFLSGTGAEYGTHELIYSHAVS